MSLAEALFAAGVQAQVRSLAGAELMEVAPQDFARAAAAARHAGMRFVSLWGDAEEDGFFVYAAFAPARGAHALVRARADATPPASLGRLFPGAVRLERHMRDLFGIALADMPDARPWTRHEHWPEGFHPLAPEADARTPMPIGEAPFSYPFARILGEGVHEVPVGPVHAGIIEPGHFRFFCAGERVLAMEERLGYVHKGIEARMRRLAPHEAVRLAGRISGDATVAHAWAFAAACEAAAGVKVPPRALALRAMLAERERLANHLGDIGAICNDAGFAFLHQQLQRLREEIARMHARLFGHRLLMDLVVPGGVACDLSPEQAEALLAHTRTILARARKLRAIYENHPGIQTRVVGTGAVSREDAERIGLLGFAGRAAGVDVDARWDVPLAPYAQLAPVRVCAEGGDVAARVFVRWEEAEAALRILEGLLGALPEGPVQVPCAPTRAACGYAVVESWRGEITGFVRLDAQGRVARYFARDPSWFAWLGLELAVRDAVIADFPLMNKSFNASYSGCDL